MKFSPILATDSTGVGEATVFGLMFIVALGIAFFALLAVHFRRTARFGIWAGIGGLLMALVSLAYYFAQCYSPKGAWSDWVIAISPAALSVLVIALGFKKKHGAKGEIDAPPCAISTDR